MILITAKTKPTQPLQHIAPSSRSLHSQKCTSKGIWRQGIVSKHRSSLQKSLLPCRHLPLLIQSVCLSLCLSAYVSNPLNPQKSDCVLQNHSSQRAIARALSVAHRKMMCARKRKQTHSSIAVLVMLHLVISALHQQCRILHSQLLSHTIAVLCPSICFTRPDTLTVPKAYTEHTPENLGAA